jgi:signal transduction histidine kinase
VARLREELRSTQDRLAALGLMVSSISHGVKGILTGLDAGAYLAESGLRKENLDQVQEGLATVKEMVERIRRVVLDVLYFAKERPLEWRRMSVHAFVADLLATASPKVQSHPIELVAEIDRNLGEFEVDQGVAAPALLNILENAVDACIEDRSKASYRITLRVGADNTDILFYISDNGVGMRPEVREKMFDLFYSSKGQAGTGLGLFITRQVVRQHGGSIEVESIPGQGSCFTVRWPRFLTKPVNGSS